MLFGIAAMQVSEKSLPAMPKSINKAFTLRLEVVADRTINPDNPRGRPNGTQKKAS
jgi:hypothetical protein